tara:strand:- start:1864 stop:2112 length:249 start_codon:yes stop_codon:yes gene_type:complete
LASKRDAQLKKKKKDEKFVRENKTKQAKKAKQVCVVAEGFRKKFNLFVHPLMMVSRTFLDVNTVECTGQEAIATNRDCGGRC